MCILKNDINNDDIVNIKTKVSDRPLGMFALILTAIGVMVYKNKVVVDYRKAGCYYDNNIHETDNVWEYYFKQPDGISIEEALCMKHNISEFNEKRCLALNFINNDWVDIRLAAKAVIDSRIILKEHIAKKIEDFYNKNMRGYNILGVQKRETDMYDVHGRGYFYSDEEAIGEVEKIHTNFDKIYLVTDNNKSLAVFCGKYGNKLIHYDNSTLSDNGQSVHKTPKHTGYKIGEDVIIEAYLLSRVNFLLAMMSNISLFAIISGGLNYKRMDSHIPYK